MALVRIENKVILIDTNQGVKYAPVTKMRGKETLHYHRGSLIAYDTKEEAEKYFEE